MDSKPFYESKTFWFNVIMFVVLFAEQIPVILPGLPEWVTATTAFVLLAGNLVLRLWFTDQPLTLK